MKKQDAVNYRPQTAILALGEAFYDPVTAADFPKTILRYRDDRAAHSIGLRLNDAQWLSHFGRFKPLDDNLAEPLALRYHGHQFQNYNPEIGDGRGFLFAQMRGVDDRLMDLGTKGSGQTPYSRRGDGRLTLLGGVREVLATRYLQYLGVNTSRSLSLIETGEDLQRHDEPSPARSGVLVRLSHSHIRFGTFQRQAFFQERDNIQSLIDYCITHFYPDAQNGADLLEMAAIASADMVAGWMAAGFVHGVMNTDNMNITGESFDYGPYRFLPVLNANHTAAYFDHNRLYAFGRQPDIMYWNLAQLAQSLSLVCEDDALKTALEAYAPAYREALRRHVFRRFGLQPGTLETDIAFIMQTFQFLEQSEMPWPQFWHDWQGGSPASGSPNDDFYHGDDFMAWRKVYMRYDAIGPKPAGDRPPSLLYDDIGALWAPITEHDDWTAFDAKLASFN